MPCHTTPERHCHQQPSKGRVIGGAEEFGKTENGVLVRFFAGVDGWVFEWRKKGLNHIRIAPPVLNNGGHLNYTQNTNERLLS